MFLSLLLPPFFFFLLHFFLLTMSLCFRSTTIIIFEVAFHRHYHRDRHCHHWFINHLQLRFFFCTFFWLLHLVSWSWSWTRRASEREKRVSLLRSGYYSSGNYSADSSIGLERVSALRDHFGCVFFSLLLLLSFRASSCWRGKYDGLNLPSLPTLPPTAAFFKFTFRLAKLNAQTQNRKDNTKQKKRNAKAAAVVSRYGIDFMLSLL